MSAIYLYKRNAEGHHPVSDGSIVYQSSLGRETLPKWFVWLFRQVRNDAEGRAYRDGDIMLGRTGIRYFSSPLDALKAIQDLRR